jgi:hypothetical protein
MYLADDEDVPSVVVPHADDLEHLVAARDAVAGFSVRRSQPNVG